MELEGPSEGLGLVSQGSREASSSKAPPSPLAGAPVAADFLRRPLRLARLGLDSQNGASGTPCAPEPILRRVSKKRVWGLIGRSSKTLPKSAPRGSDLDDHRFSRFLEPVLDANMPSTSNATAPSNLVHMFRIRLTHPDIGRRTPRSCLTHSNIGQHRPGSSRSGPASNGRAHPKSGRSISNAGRNTRKLS